MQFKMLKMKSKYHFFSYKPNPTPTQLKKLWRSVRQQRIPESETLKREPSGGIICNLISTKPKLKTCHDSPLVHLGWADFLTMGQVKLDLWKI